MSAQLDLRDVPSTSESGGDPWHIVHLDGDMVAICGHVLKGETATRIPPDEDICAACLVLAEIPCGCGVCS